MRTWKQGIIGNIKLSQSLYLYIHCLKYPLGKLYKEYANENNTLNKYMFRVMVDKSVLKNIERIGEIRLSKEERQECEIFRYGSRENKIYLNERVDEDNESLEKMYKIEEIVEKYNKESKDNE